MSDKNPAAVIYSVDYYYTTVEDKPGEGCKFLELLAREEVNLLAFNAFPIGADKTQLIIYPLNTTWLTEVARKKNIALQGPNHALMVHGDDELGALVDIHRKLCDEHINIASSSGMTDGRGGYRYIMHLGPDDFSRACEVLEVKQAPENGHEINLDIFRRFHGKGSVTTPLKKRRRPGAI